MTLLSLPSGYDETRHIQAGRVDCHITVGFESATDWDELGEAVVARGYSRGDVLHLPEIDTDE